MIEVRRMRATNEELKSLIGNLMASDGIDRGAPAGKFAILDMAYTSDKPVKLRVTGQFNDGRQLTVNLTPELIIASFVIFCTEAGIPISRQSVKSVTRLDDGVAFDMVIKNLDVETAPALPDQIKCAFMPVGSMDLTSRYGANAPLRYS